MLLNPEIKMVECLVKHVYIQYPSVAAFFRSDNLSKITRRVYFLMVRFINQLLKFWSGPDEGSSRVGLKVAKMTNEDYVHNLMSQKYAIPQQIQPYHRFIRQSTNYENIPTKMHKKEKKSMGNAEFTNHEVMDPDARIDLNDKAIEREADELFNIDKMFWKSFGFDSQQTLKKYSLPHCGKEYITDVFSRFIKNIILN